MSGSAVTGRRRRADAHGPPVRSGARRLRRTRRLARAGSAAARAVRARFGRRTTSGRGHAGSAARHSTFRKEDSTRSTLSRHQSSTSIGRHFTSCFPVGAIPSRIRPEPEALHTVHAGEKQDPVLGMHQNHCGPERQVETSDERRNSGSSSLWASIVLIAQDQDAAHIALASHELQPVQQTAPSPTARLPHVDVLPASRPGPRDADTQVTSKLREKNGHGFHFTVPLDERVEDLIAEWRHCRSGRSWRSPER